jgi:hypothetical protein
MRKVGTAHPTSPSPAIGSVSGSGALGGQAMRRVGSGGELGHNCWMVDRADQRRASSIKAVDATERNSSPAVGEQSLCYIPF